MSRKRQEYTSYRPNPQSYSYARRIESRKKSKNHSLFKLLIVFLILIGASFVLFEHASGNTTSFTTVPSVEGKPKASSKTIAKAKINYCESNTLSKEIVVKLSLQKLWACHYSTSIYSSPVITGYTKYAADKTPTGTYSVFTKEKNVTLRGTDGVTTWSDPVSYWMPFLFNKYGAYGLHDATWVSNSLYGHVNVNTDYKNSSKGCVELPLLAAKWVYGWVQVGTQIVIEA